jgi:xanthine dehydrogenase YagR molybdenum-binding subunit
MNSTGQPLNRVDGVRKVTGSATFSAEHKIPRLAHAVLVMSTIASGRISAVDSVDAECPA